VREAKPTKNPSAIPPLSLSSSFFHLSEHIKIILEKY